MFIKWHPWTKEPNVDGDSVKAAKTYDLIVDA